MSCVCLAVSKNTTRLLDSRDANDNEEFIQSGCSGSEYIVGGGRFGESSVSLPTSTTVPTTTSSTTTMTTVASTTPSTTTRPTTPSISATTTSSFYVGNRRNIDRAAADEQQPVRDWWTTTTQFYQQRYSAVLTVLPQPNYPVLDDGS